MSTLNIVLICYGVICITCYWGIKNYYLKAHSKTYSYGMIIAVSTLNTLIPGLNAYVATIGYTHWIALWLLNRKLKSIGRKHPEIKSKIEEAVKMIDEFNNQS